MPSQARKLIVPPEVVSVPSEEDIQRDINKAATVVTQELTREFTLETELSGFDIKTGGLLNSESAIFWAVKVDKQNNSADYLYVVQKEGEWKIKQQVKISDENFRVETVKIIRSNLVYIYGYEKDMSGEFTHKITREFVVGEKK